MDNNIQVASLVQEIRALQREVEKLKTREYLSPKRTSSTPVWTASTTNPVIGDGSISGRFSRAGALITFSFNIIMGASTTYGGGTWFLSLPVTAVYAGAGALWMYDSGSAPHAGVCRLYSTTTIELVGSAGVVTPTYPFTWASGDALRGTFVYFA